MSGKYIPPGFKNKPDYKPIKLDINDKLEIKSKEQLFDRYKKENDGKADDAWD